jgi:hypothetical protein
MATKKKTKWNTTLRNGDLIKLGEIWLTVTKGQNSPNSIGMTVEAPREVKITKQELSGENKKL